MNDCAGIILSDLDGTFLNDAYRPALTAHELARVTTRWRVVWVTNRSVDEVLALQRVLNHHDDAIAENGGACLVRSAATAARLGTATLFSTGWRVLTAAPYAETRALVSRAFDEAGAAVRTFDDLEPDELADRSAYEVDDARRAQRRHASVVLVDADPRSPATLAAIRTLRESGCTVTDGGRWLTVVRGADKGSTAQAWLRAVGNHAPVIAIGDGENDEGLLAQADVAFVIRRESGAHHPTLASLPRARLLEAAGTAGWREMIESLDTVTAGSAHG